MAMTDSGTLGHAADAAQYDAWPPALRTWFDGTALARKTGFTASLVTYQADGRLGTSLLGIGELYAPGAPTLRFALWAQSRAARALAGGARAALTFVFDEAFHQVQMDVVALHSDAAQAAGLACFEGTIAALEVQRVHYARLRDGITFTLDEASQDTVSRRWETQIELLKGAG